MFVVFVDVAGMVRRGAVGAFAGDPTVPSRPGRLTRLRLRRRTRRMIGTDAAGAPAARGRSCVVARRPA